MLGTWSMAPSIPGSDGSAAPRMSLTLRARLPNESSAMACSSATIEPQSSWGPPAPGGGVVGATCAGAACGVGKVGYVAVGACTVGGGALGIAAGVGMAGNCCVGGCCAGAAGGGGGGGGDGLRGADRWPEETTSSTSRGGCLTVSADLTSIIADGSSQRASARSGLSEMSRDSLVYAPASSPSDMMITPVPALERIITLPLNFRSLKNLSRALISTQAAYSSVYMGFETVSS